MEKIYGLKDLKIAREIGIDDVLVFLNTEKFDSISEQTSLMLVEELLKKRVNILGCADKMISLIPQS